jgi:carboxyl-terminal processing protease
MRRLVPHFVIALTLWMVVPASAEAQDRAPGNRPPGNDEAEIFLQTFRHIRDYSLEAFGDSLLWEKAIEGLVRELDDPYAEVFTPVQVDEFREETTGNYAGIGVQITGLNNAITITAVFRGTPAEGVGIQVGDRIVGVNGESTEGWSTGQASDVIRGEVGTTVEVTVARDGIPQAIRHQIQRDSVHLSAVTAERLEGNVGYVLLDRVARNSTAEMDSALVMLEDSRGIIIDLRRNPGGYLDESLGLADLFLDEGDVLLSSRGRVPRQPGQQSEDVAYGRVPKRVADLPLIVLVDEYSASASEILAGALQDHDRALVLGERTFGKGLVQTILPLPHGRQLRLTTAEWFTPLGRSLHRPRDMEGRLLPENPDSLPDFQTAGGRQLKGGGGVFPDLVVEDDTLKLRERDLLANAAQAEVPLAVRIQESAFEAAKAYRAGTGPDGITDEAFLEFSSSLEEQGMDPEILTDPEAAQYLRWRLRIAFAERADEMSRALEVRAERDVVLARAIELMKQAGDQGELFALADDAVREAGAVRTGQVDVPPKGTP